MATPSPPQPRSPYEVWRDAVASYREALRWVIGALAAVGAVVAASAPIAGVRGLDSADDPGLAAVGAVVALFGVAITVSWAARAMQPRLVEWHDLNARKRAWGARKFLKYAETEHELHDTKTAEAILEFSNRPNRTPYQRVQDAIDLARQQGRPPDPLTLGAVRRAEWRARYTMARSHFRQALVAALFGVAAIGIGLALVLEGLASELEGERAEAQAQREIAEVMPMLESAGVLDGDTDAGRLGPRILPPSLTFKNDAALGLVLVVAAEAQILMPAEWLQLELVANSDAAEETLGLVEGRPDATGKATTALEFPLGARTLDEVEVRLAVGSGDMIADECDEPLVRCSTLALPPVNQLATEVEHHPAVQASVADGRVTGSATTLGSGIDLMAVRVVSIDASGNVTQLVTATSGPTTDGLSVFEFDSMVPEDAALVIAEAQRLEAGGAAQFRCSMQVVVPGCVVLATD